MTTSRDSVAAHAGQPLRLSHPWIGATAITMISARSRGPISHEAATMPPTAITAAAAPSRITTPRGNELVTAERVDVEVWVEVWVTAGAGSAAAARGTAAS